ncbi:MAG TPA: DUF3185 family protein [Planctomycetota bacterium]|nr:DUF3185 family protein [Planctomycetota bacterium]
MSKLLWLGLVVGGIVLLVYGIQASESIASDFSRLFTGAPTDKSVWLMVGGVVLTVIGLAGVSSGPRATS